LLLLLLLVGQKIHLAYYACMHAAAFGRLSVSARSLAFHPLSFVPRAPRNGKSQVPAFIVRSLRHDLWRYDMEIRSSPTLMQLI
jgi:hypothetical protein